MTKQKTRKRDPHAAREAAKYVKPVPSREYITATIKAHKAPVSLQEICKLFRLRDPESIEGIRRRLKAMLRDGQLEQVARRRYWLVGKRRLIKGIVTIDKKNTLWVIPEDRSARIALPYFTDKNVMRGNTVIVSVPDLPPQTEPLEGKVVEIIEQPDLTITGRYVLEDGLSYVVSFSKDFLNDIAISLKDNLDANNGQIVVVEILTQESNRTDPVGKIVEILGDERNKNVEIESALRKYSIPYTWPDNVREKATKFKEQIPKNAARGRVDLRELPLVTIDGEDARDFDDAVFAEPRSGGGWRLFVAIADVSHYVKPADALDKEASMRGNSVYFPTRVVPMLPEVLSNGLCSLRPHVDRLCMVCEMNISRSGKLTRYEFYPGVMHSHARLTYTKVAKILEGDKYLRAEYSDLLEDIENLAELYEVLHSARTERGAIDFETVETSISFGKKGLITKITPVERNIAHRIIEECMLSANVATARFLDKHKIPGLYRNHEGPPEDKLSDLRTFLRELGLSLGTGNKKTKPKPLDYGTLLQKIKNRPDQKMIQTVMLRSLSQAVYAPDNLGHFGLAYPAYTHFTSPIRRYPDLIVHRQIKKILSDKWDKDWRKDKAGQKRVEKMEQELSEIAGHCCITERRADDATRDVIMSLKCQYVKQHVGTVFKGVISGVTSFGLFVELQDLYVDGLVHIASMDQDYYVYDSVHHRLTGERTGVVYSIGQEVEVLVVKVNTDEQKIDFKIVTKHRGKAKKSKSSKSRGKQKVKKKSSSKRRGRR